MGTIRDATALIDTDTLRAEVQLKYTEVAQHPETGFHFHTGRPLARLIGYPPNVVDPLPDSVVESFVGVNNPFSMGVMRPGERVLDVGSGTGFDSVIAAQQVGPTGSVTGVDMTDATLEKARANARLMGLDNLTFEKGFAEVLPLADGSVDVVISNGVINLCPDKSAVYREIWRVLRPGGRIQLADVVVQKPVDEGAQEDIDLWTGWIAGALLVAEHIDVIRDAGFTDIEVGSMIDVFSGSAQESDAGEFDTRGIVLSGGKPYTG